MKTAIITGVTGMDGSYLSDLLLEKGYRVIGISRRTSTSNTKNIRHILNHPNFILEPGDITDTHSISTIFQKYSPNIDEVYNLAAQSHVKESFNSPGLTWDITGKGCLNVLNSMKENGLISTPFYQASSSEMFGKNFDVSPCGDMYQDENTKLLPQSPYAIAKCAAHHITRLYREAYGAHASCGILFNHEGPRRGEEFVTRKITKWIGEFYKWTKKTGIDPNTLVQTSDDILYASGHPESFPKLRLGNLNAFRDFGYAPDYCEAIWLITQQAHADDYVICTGQTHTIKELLSVAFEYIGIKDWSNYIVIDPKFYRPAEVDYLRGENIKARTKLGWWPKTSFSELVKRMVENDIQA